MPERFSWISLSDMVDWQIKPWEWDDIGLEWIRYIRIWCKVKPEAQALHQRLFSK